MHLSEADHAAVTQAVSRAELTTDGEIVTVVAARSDRYGDVAAYGAVLAMLSVLALLSASPGIAQWLYLATAGDWNASVPAGGLFTVALLLLVAAFLLARALLASMRLRLLLTPQATRARRVHRRALELFRVAVEGRTRAATGVLLYVSLAERRAEIVADRAIHARVDHAVWGDAMQALISALRDGRAGEGMAEAVSHIGAVLAEHFPRRGDDLNELPDRLIEM